MPRNGHERREKTKTQGLYDRIADVQNLAMKINGYRASVAKYLKSLDLDIGPDSLVLDAGCGTGLVTLAFQEAGYRPGRIEAVDLSFRSLTVARDEFSQRRHLARRCDTIQSNVLAMPFADDTFDLMLMCGVLEYTPLDAGLGEAARVLKKGAPLVFLPVKPSVVGSVLELLYNFKTHKKADVRAAAAKYFNVVGNYEFPDHRADRVVKNDLFAGKEMSKSPLIIGHRGASAHAPENTLAAFRVALDAGADGVEFDVQLSKDGVPVVIHDDTLERTGLRVGSVSDLTAKKLGKIDVGSWFNKKFPKRVKPEFAKETIPTSGSGFESFERL